LHIQAATSSPLAATVTKHDLILLQRHLIAKFSDLFFISSLGSEDPTSSLIKQAVSTRLIISDPRNCPGPLPTLACKRNCNCLDKTGIPSKMTSTWPRHESVFFWCCEIEGSCAKQKVSKVVRVFFGRSQIRTSSHQQWCVQKSSSRGGAARQSLTA